MRKEIREAREQLNKLLTQIRGEELYEEAFDRIADIIDELQEIDKSMDQAEEYIEKVCGGSY